MISILERIKVSSSLFLPKIIYGPIAEANDFAWRSILNFSGFYPGWIPMLHPMSVDYMLKNKFINLREDEKVILQLFGKAQDFELAKNNLKKVYEKYRENFALINLNFGCSVSRVVKRKAGSRILEEKEDMLRIIDIVREVFKDIPLSVKFRLGFSYNNFYENLEFFNELEIPVLFIHVRLGKDMFKSNVDYKLISDWNKFYKGILYVNGDIKDRETLIKALNESKASGAMIARALLGKPGWLLSNVYGYGREYEHKFNMNCLLLHLKLIDTVEERERTKANFMKFHIAHYLKGFKNAKKVRMKCFLSDNFKYIRKVVEEFLLTV